jgi:hypothetical protein
MFKLQLNQILLNIDEFRKLYTEMSLLTTPLHECTITEEYWECDFCSSYGTINAKINSINYKIKYNNMLEEIINKIIEFIDQHDDIKRLFNILCDYIDSFDLIFLCNIAIKHKANSVIDFFKIKRLYHYEDHSVVYKYNDIDCKYTHKYTTITVRLLRVLVGVFVYGIIDKSHIKAIFFLLKQTEQDNLKALINRIFRNYDIIVLFQDVLLSNIQKFSYSELSDNYKILNIDFLYMTIILLAINQNIKTIE